MPGALVFENPANIVGHRPVTNPRVCLHVLVVLDGEAWAKHLGVLLRDGPFPALVCSTYSFLCRSRMSRSLSHGGRRRLILLQREWVVRRREERVGQRREYFFCPGGKLGVDLG